MVIDGIKSWLSKRQIANLVAAFILIAGFCYAAITRNDRLVENMIMVALGYLLKTVVEKQ